MKHAHLDFSDSNTVKAKAHRVIVLADVIVDVSGFHGFPWFSFGKFYSKKYQNLVRISEFLKGFGDSI